VMRVGVVGAGAVGARAARQLVSSTAVARVLIDDQDEARASAVAASLGEDQASVSDSRDVDVALLTMPGAQHAARARELLERGVPVVSVADGIDEVRALLDLDAVARAREVSLVVGAGFSPGLTCVLMVWCRDSIAEMFSAAVAVRPEPDCVTITGFEPRASFAVCTVIEPVR